MTRSGLRKLLRRPAGPPPEDGADAPSPDPAARAAAKAEKAAAAAAKAEARAAKAATVAARAAAAEAAAGPPASEAVALAEAVVTRQREHGDLARALERAGWTLVQTRPEHHYVSTYYGSRHEKLNTPLEDPAFAGWAAEVQAHGRTFLTASRLYTLYQALHNVALGARSRGEEIRVVEAGAYRGGSAHYMAGVLGELAPGAGRIDTCDTFEGHSPLDLPDGQEGAHKPGKFSKASFEGVAEYLSPFEWVTVHRGRIQDVAPGLGDGPFHLVHVDVDIAAPTTWTLEHFRHRLAPGGLFVIDDYNFKTCPGSKRAIDEFWEAQAGRYHRWELQTGQALVVPVGA